jgi:nicotinate-nucleotide adenylyltransferase
MGGTFDPIHHGHLVAASEVGHFFSLDEVVFVPTGQPWQKDGREVSAAEDRYLMTVIATASNPRFSVSRVDIDRPGPTYTIDTLRELRAARGDLAELFFITGADALEQLMSWRDADELFELAHFVGCTRPGHRLSGAGLPDERVSLIEIPALTISSTASRSGTWCRTGSCSTSRNAGSTSGATAEPQRRDTLNRVLARFAGLPSGAET